MQVTIFIDLATDISLLELCKDDGKIFGLFQIYDAFGDDKYITMIAKHIWNKSYYRDLIVQTCGEDIFAFHYCADWIFEFQTSEENGALLKLLSPTPKAISIVYPNKTPHDELTFKV